MQLKTIITTKKFFEMVRAVKDSKNIIPDEAVNSLKSDYLKTIKFDPNSDSNLLHFAALLDSDALFQLLLTIASEQNYMQEFTQHIKSINSDFYTPLMYAIFSKNGIKETMCKNLLASGAPFNNKIFQASFEGNISEMEKLLLIDPNILLETDPIGNSAIFYAVANNKKEAVRFIMEKNPKFNIKNENGMNIMHFIAINNHIELLQLFSDPNFQETPAVNINETDNERYTPLHFAVLNEHFEMASWLKETGADCTIKNIENESIAFLVKISDNQKIKDLFKVEIELEEAENVLKTTQTDDPNNQKNTDQSQNNNDNKKQKDTDLDRQLEELLKKGDEKAVREFLFKLDLNNRKNNTVEQATPSTTEQNHISPMKSPLSTKDLFKSLDDSQNDKILAETKKMMKMPTYNPDEFNAQGFSLLHLATMANFEALVLLLLEGRPETNYKDRFSQRPLNYAIFNKAGMKKSICTALLTAKAKAAVFDRKIFKACFEGNVAKIEELISKDKKDLQRTDSGGNTAIFYAVVNNQKEAVQYIINLNPAYNVKNDDGMTILHFIAINNHLELLKFLFSDPNFQKFSQLNVNEKDKEGYTPLHYAVLNGHSEMITLLMNNGADSTIKNTFNESPADLAQESKSDKVIALFKKEPDPTKKEKSEVEEKVETAMKTLQFKNANLTIMAWDENYMGEQEEEKGKENYEALLEKALEENDQEKVQWILAQMDTENEKNNKKFTNLSNYLTLDQKLLVAVSFSQLDEVKLLIKEGAYINYRNPNQETALIIATRLNYLEMVKLCMELGANPFLLDDEMKSAKDYAQTTEMFELLKTYMETKAKTSKPSFWNSNQQNTSTQETTSSEIKSEKMFPEFNALNSEKTQSNKPITISTHSDYQTSSTIEPKYALTLEEQLLQAVSNGEVVKAKLLIEAGADINFTNPRLETALHIAVKSQNKEMIKILKEYSADPFLPDMHQKQAIAYSEGEMKDDLLAYMENYQRSSFNSFCKFKTSEMRQTDNNHSPESQVGIIELEVLNQEQENTEDEVEERSLTLK